MKAPHPPQAVPLPLIGEGKSVGRVGAYNKCCMRTLGVFVEVVVVFVSHREDEEWERCVRTPHPPQAVPLPLIGEGKVWSKRSLSLFGGKARVWGRVQQMLYADAGGVAVFVSRKKARVGE